MLTIEKSVNNLKSCLYTKVKADRYKNAHPSKIDVVFDIRLVQTEEGYLAPHLIAKDKATGSFIYLCEVFKRTNSWIVKENQFYPQIYTFVKYILEQFSYVDTDRLPVHQSGEILKGIARESFLKFK